MESLPSDLLIKIAEATPEPDVTLSHLSRVNKRTHELIPPIRLTATVARQLQRRPLSPTASETLKLILDECAKKMQAQREQTKDGTPLTTLALNSVSLEQHMLKQVKQELARARQAHSMPGAFIGGLPRPQPPPQRTPQPQVQSWSQMQTPVVRASRDDPYEISVD